MTAIHCAVVVLLLLSGAPSLTECQTRDDLQKQLLNLVTENTYSQDGTRGHAIKGVSRSAENVFPDRSDIYRRNSAGKGPGNFVRIGRGSAGSLRQYPDVADRSLPLIGQQQLENEPQQSDVEQKPDMSSMNLRLCLLPQYGSGHDVSVCLLQALSQLANNKTTTKRNGAASPGGKFVRIGRSHLTTNIGSKRKRSSRENRFVRIGRRYE